MAKICTSEFHKKLIRNYLLTDSVQEMDRIKNINRIIQNTENKL